MSWFADRFSTLLGTAAVGEGAASVASDPPPTKEIAWRCEVCKRVVEAHVQHVCSGEPATRLNDSERLGYDAVHLPQHYKAFPVEPIRFCQENGLSFLQASIIKYVVRFNHKNGVEDLKKAARCLDMLLAFEEGDPDWWKLPGERASKRFYLID